MALQKLHVLSCILTKKLKRWKCSHICVVTAVMDDDKWLIRSQLYNKAFIESSSMCIENILYPRYFLNLRQVYFNVVNPICSLSITFLVCVQVWVISLLHKNELCRNFCLFSFHLWFMLNRHILPLKDWLHLVDFFSGWQVCCLNDSASLMFCSVSSVNRSQHSHLHAC